MTDENKPVRMAFSVTHGRVQYYDDIIQYMIDAEVSRFKDTYKRMPTQEQIAFFKKELIRYAVIRHDLQTAQKLQIPPHNILNEQREVCY